MGKSENWHLLLFLFRYFDKRFSELFIESSSIKHMFLVLILSLIDCHGNLKATFAKNIKKKKKIKTPRKLYCK